MATRKTTKSGAAKPVTVKPVASVASVATSAPSKTDPPAKDKNTVMVRRKEMVERIVATSGLKPNAVKSVLDAVLEELGKALSEGEGLNLHPLGKVTVNRQKILGDKEILVCKIRRKLPGAAAPQPMDTAAE